MFNSTDVMAVIVAGKLQVTIK